MRDEVWMWAHQNMEWVKFYEKFTQWKQTTALTFLFPTMVNLINKTMNVSDVVWMLVHQKYGMSQIVQIMYSVETNNLFYLTVPGDGRFNWQNNECEWWSMYVSASKMGNESNRMKIEFNRNNQMLLPCCYQICTIE